jgi:hypothetical protein
VSRFSKRIPLYLSCLFILYVIYQLLYYKLSIGRDELADRLFGILMGGAVADAMAGPYEGRSTEESQQFLEDGGWIDRFNKPYSRWYQSHWNVYEQGAEPGTYTDDTRLRLFLVESMIQFGEKEPFDKLYLANEIFEKYRVARTQYVDADKDVVKERFLEMWFWWELTKLASSVVIPTPALLSPSAMREALVDASGNGLVIGK